MAPSTHRTNPLRATPAVTIPWSAVKVSHKVGLNIETLSYRRPPPAALVNSALCAPVGVVSLRPRVLERLHNVFCISSLHVEYARTRMHGNILNSNSVAMMQNGRCLAMISQTKVVVDIRRDANGLPFLIMFLTDGHGGNSGLDSIVDRLRQNPDVFMKALSFGDGCDTGRSRALARGGEGPGDALSH